MNSRDFCFWLQGWFEVQFGNSAASMDASQAEIVRKHLALVFKHEIDPSQGPPEHQAELDAIHNPPSPLTSGSGAQQISIGPAHGPGGVTMRC